MIPLRDVIPSRTTPVVTLALLTLLTLAFAAERLFAVDLGALAPWTLGSTLAHVNAAHLAGNLLALWIFGPAVEDRMGHDRFVVFYLLCSAAAAAAHAATASTLAAAVGAGGAIAGVAGAYFVLFPRSRIVILLPLPTIKVVEMPAIALLALWLALQLVVGAGLASWNVVGGFAAGLLAVGAFRRRERLRVEWWNDV